MISGIEKLTKQENAELEKFVEFVAAGTYEHEYQLLRDKECEFDKVVTFRIEDDVIVVVRYKYGKIVSWSYEVVESD